MVAVVSEKYTGSSFWLYTLRGGGKVVWFSGSSVDGTDVHNWEKPLVNNSSLAQIHAYTPAIGIDGCPCWPVGVWVLIMYRKSFVMMSPFCIVIGLFDFKHTVKMSKWKTLKCGNRSTEVWRKATYPCSVPYWHTLCVLRPCSQKVTLPCNVRAGS